MPSNKITINGNDKLSWEVPDSRLEAVIALLDSVGDRQDPAPAQQALIDSRKDHDKRQKEKAEKA